jgi:hypothetical protein
MNKYSPLLNITITALGSYSSFKLYENVFQLRITLLLQDRHLSITKQMYAVMHMF